MIMETIILLKRIFFWYVATVAKHKSNEEIFCLSLLFLMMSIKRKEKTIEIQRHAPLIYEEVMNRKSGWTIGFYLLSKADDRSMELMNVIYFIR